MRTFQPVDCFGADPLNQRDAVIHDVPGQLGVARRALAVAVKRLEAKCRITANSAVMPCVVFALVVAAATDARQFGVALVKRIGAEAVDWLEGPHEPKKYTIEELKAMTADYRAKTRDLKKDAA